MPSRMEVIEELEPTIGLEPMTCRLRTEDKTELSTTEPISDDVTQHALGEATKGDDPTGLC